MHSLILFLSICVVVALGAFKEECKKLAHPSLERCCKIVPQDKYNIKGCEQETSSPQSCARNICFAKKYGMAGAVDGTIDKEAATALIKEDLVDYPEIFESVIKNCFEKDLKQLGPENVCELAKTGLCIHMVVLANCDKWDDDEKCSGIKELAQECTKPS